LAGPESENKKKGRESRHAPRSGRQRKRREKEKVDREGKRLGKLRRIRTDG